MTAPATLPAEVQAIVRALADGPSILDGVPQTAINAAFDHGVIRVYGSKLVNSSEPWRTKYALRGQVTPSADDQASRPAYRLELS